METKSTLIVDLLVLLILFCESCGRQVSLDNAAGIKGNLEPRSRYSNWYTTPAYSNSFNNNGFIPYTNQNLGYPYSHLPPSAYQDYFGGRQPRQEEYESRQQYPDFSNGLDAPMSSYGHPHHVPYHHGYSDKYDGTRELVNTNKKGFALLGLLSLMAVLQGLLASIVLQFTTTTTTTTSAPTPAPNTTAPARIKKRISRSVSPSVRLYDGDTTERIMELVLPSLNSIGHIGSGTLPASCALHELCLIHRTLKEELQGHGHSVGDKFFLRIQTFLEEDARHREFIAFHIRSFMRARQRIHLDCLFYPICPEMRNLDFTIQRLPPLLTLDDYFSKIETAF